MVRLSAFSRVLLSVGTLYLVGALLDESEDITLRALRILAQAGLVVADASTDTVHVGRLLAHHRIATPLASLSVPSLSAIVPRILKALQAGDVALLTPELLPGPSALARDLVCAARNQGYPVVSVPGPSLLVTALILAGLPAESFRYLGELPQQGHVRRALLSSVEAERRTLVLLVSSGRSTATLADLAGILGERPLAVISAADLGPGGIWRGTIAGVSEEHLHQFDPAPAILVVGGAQVQAARWGEQRLRAEVQARRDQGLGAKEVSQQLAGESGWSRREIYRIAVEAGRFRRSE